MEDVQSMVGLWRYVGSMVGGGDTVHMLAAGLSSGLSAGLAALFLFSPIDFYRQAWELSTITMINTGTMVGRWAQYTRLKNCI